MQITRTSLVAASVVALGLAVAPAASAHAPSHRTPQSPAAAAHHAAPARPSAVHTPAAHRPAPKQPNAPKHPSVTKPAAQHEIPFTAATVTDHHDGTFTIAWTAPGVSHVAIYTGATQDRIDTRHVVAQGGSTGSVTVKVAGKADRQWFELDPNRGDELTLADRAVTLDGAINVRDAGGYRTADGQWVAMGKVYRAAALDQLTDADLATLQRLGVRTDIDLRTAEERTAQPDRVPAGTRYVVADVLGGSVSTQFNATTPDAAVQMMVDGERTMVSSDTAHAAYTQLFDLVEQGKGAVLFHCSAGKDRTGWGAAALLTTLGVPASTVQSDYLLSNVYRADANAATLAALPADYAAIYKPLLDVRPEYLAAGFDEVRVKYGTFPRYLDKALGVDARDVRTLKDELLVH